MLMFWWQNVLIDRERLSLEARDYDGEKKNLTEMFSIVWLVLKLL